VVPATQAAAVDGSITPVDRAGNHADQSAPAAVIVVVVDGARWVMSCPRCSCRPTRRRVTAPQSHAHVDRAHATAGTTRWQLYLSGSYGRILSCFARLWRAHISWMFSTTSEEPPREYEMTWSKCRLSLLPHSTHLPWSRFHTASFTLVGMSRFCSRRGSCESTTGVASGSTLSRLWRTRHRVRPARRVRERLHALASEPATASHEAPSV